MNTILIPLDGSELAESALDPALRLAARHGAKVVLASVVSDLPPVPLAAGDGEMVSRWFADEEKRAGAYLAGIEARLVEANPGLTVETRVAVGPVARTLMQDAEAVRADLIVSTTHGRGAWQRAWLGSIADALLRGARRPLLLLREGGASADLFADEASPHHVLVPLDGSGAAEGVLPPLTSILPARGGQVTLLSVVRRPSAMSTTYLPHAIEGDAVRRERKEEMETYLRGVADGWNPLGVRLGTEVVVADDVARTVLEYAEGQGVDLVALSTRGRGGVGRLVLGSVADKIIRGAGLPVLAVRRGRDSGE